MENLIGVIEETIKSYLQTQLYENGLMLAKTLAVSIILINFIDKYLKNLDDKQVTIYKWADFIKPSLHIILICSFNFILELLDGIADAFFGKLEKGEPMFQVLLKIEEQIKEGGSYNHIKGLSSNIFRFFGSIEGILCKGVCWMIGMFDILIYSVFSAERYFLLGVSNLLFPLLLAFSALDMFKEYITKGFKFYLSLVIRIYILYLAMNVGEKVFHQIYAFIRGGDRLATKGIFSNGSFDDMVVLIIAGIIAVALKLKLIKAGISYLNRILT